MTLLRLANKPLELANGFVRWLYRKGILSTLEAPIPVISVGNITMGGTGKTPLVEALARELLAAGLKPAVVTRGYRRKGKTPLVLGGDPKERWYWAGDEPSLLAKRLPQIPVIVNANRFRGCLTAVSHGATHILLDDGFQHFKLGRQRDLVVVSAADPLGDYSLRREDPSALGFAFRIVTVGQPQDQTGAAQVLASYHPRPPFPAWLRPQAWVWQGKTWPLSELQGRKVVAFAGIAKPSRFFALLASLEAVMVKAIPFQDHHNYSRAQLLKILTMAEQHGATAITTAKDHIRLPEDLSQKVAFLDVCLVPLHGLFLELLEGLVPPSGRIVP